MIIQVIGAFVAIVAFAVIIETPKRLLVQSGIVAAFAWFFYLFTKQYTSNVVMTSFVSAFVVTVMSEIFAIKFKVPAFVFLVAGILPIVPGGSIYRSVYYLMTSDIGLSNYYFIETLRIAGVIAMAILVIESVIRIWKKPRKR